MESTDYGRRRFLRTGAVAGIALGVAGLGAGEVLAESARLRLGFIGVGGRGTGLLKDTLALDRTDVVAICDINEDNLNRALGIVQEAGQQKPTGYSKGEYDYRNLLERADVGAVVIATPCDWHARMYLDAFSAKKHFYGEKPMCITVQEGRDLVGAQMKHPDVVAQIGFQRRGNPRYIEAIRLIHRDEIGELVEGRAAWDNAWGPLRGWFGQRERSGDWMLEQACHTWDVYNWVLRSTPIRAFGTGRKDIFPEPGRDVTDYYTAVIEWPKGFSLMFHHSWFCPPDGTYTGVFEKVVGRKGGCQLGDGRFTFREGEPKQKQVGESVNDTRSLLANFFDCVRSGHRPNSGVHTAFDAVLVGLLVRAAVDKGGVVTWNEMLKMG